MYYNVVDASIVDYTGGVADIHNKTIHIIGDAATRYQEDPVRMLRALRFSAKLDFTLSMIGLGLVGAFACVNRFPSELLATGVLVSMTASFAKILDYGRGRVAVNAWDDFSARSGRILRTELYKAWVALWTLQGVSLVLALGVYALPRISNASVLPFVILAICVVAQTFHRWLYFASVVYRRMPGAST